MNNNAAYAKQIKTEMRELRSEMKADGIRTISCFNAGLTAAEYRCNARLFHLKVELSKVTAQAVA